MKIEVSGVKYEVRGVSTADEEQRTYIATSYSRALRA